MSPLPQGAGYVVPKPVASSALQYDGSNGQALIDAVNTDTHTIVDDGGTLYLVDSTNDTRTEVHVTDWVVYGGLAIPSVVTDADAQRSYRQVNDDDAIIPNEGTSP